jgi:HK97 gp10 family phage protein
LSVDSNFDKVKKGYLDESNAFNDQVNEELNRIGSLQQERASLDAPVDTGYLASHIEKNQEGPDTVTVVATAEYSGYVDQGTYKMAANPFFTRNVERIQAEEIPNIEKNLSVKIGAKINIVR